MNSNVPTTLAPDSLAPLAFLAGWAVSDKLHLPSLPEILVRGLGVAYACVKITRFDDTPVLEARYPEGESAGCVRLAFQPNPHAAEFSRPLGTQYTCTLRIDASPGALTPEQQNTFAQLAEMVHAALQILYVDQHTRESLGAPFSQFSDREWYVAEALDSPESEKVIASKTGSSPHTIHCHVKSVYKKLLVQSRLEVMFRLNEARARFRRGAVFNAATGHPPAQASSPENHANPMRASA